MFLNIKEYLEIDPKAKNEQWADRLITHFRTYWQPLVDPRLAEENMKIILSRYDMTNVMKMFKDPKKMAMEFIPIAVLEKVRNILIGERMKAGLSVNLNAIDPTAESEREADKKLLENRRQLETLLTFMQQKIGLPEYKISQEEARGNKGPFKGNVKLFDDLGLDDTNGYQISYFFQAWHRLLHEMRGQEAVNFFFEYNELKDYINAWVDDILAKKCIAGQSYVNEISGAIDHKRLAPEIVRLIAGSRRDGKDAVCLGYDQTVTVREVLQRMGNGFDWNRDMPYLVNAVNYANRMEITGIWDGTNILWGHARANSKQTTCSYNDFLNFKVSLGYIEWKSFDADAYKLGVDWHGNLRYIPKPPTTSLDESSKYVKESWYNEVTYKSYYLSTSSNTQKLFKFGKLYHQTVEGEEDEYSNFSIFFVKEAGPTVAEVAKPWIEIVQEAFTKFRWMVRKAKPKGRAYNYESLIKVAQKMIKEGSDKAKIHEVIKMFEEGINEIFTIPEINGEKVGGGVNPNYDLPNGLDATAITFKQIVEWGVESIKNDLGINEIREAYSPKPNDGFKLQMNALEQSRNATHYMSEMIDNLLRQYAKYTLWQVQDIIRYKDTKPYNFLKRAIGKMSIRDISELEGVSFHRYGIFVNSFATYMDRQRVLAETNQAWQNKEISFETKMLIDAIDDYRKASYILAFEKLQAKKEKEKEVQILHSNQMALEKAQHDNKMQQIITEGNLRIRERQVQGYYYYQAAIAQGQSRENIQLIKQEGKPDEVNLKSQAKMEEIRLKESLENTKPLPT